MKADGTVDRRWPGTNSYVYALARSGSTLYLGGDFSRVGGVVRRGVAAVSTGSRNVTDWNPGLDGEVRALVVLGSTVYMGGTFGSVGHKPRSGLAAVDAHTGAVTAWNPSPTASGARVFALAASGSTIYAGGLEYVGEEPRAYVAEFDAGNSNGPVWKVNCSATGFSDDIYALTVSGSTVFVGGQFTAIDGESRHDLAALDRRTGTVIDWNPNPGLDLKTQTISRWCSRWQPPAQRCMWAAGLPRSADDSAPTSRRSAHAPVQRLRGDRARIRTWRRSRSRARPYTREGTLTPSADGSAATSRCSTLTRGPSPPLPKPTAAWTRWRISAQESTWAAPSPASATVRDITSRQLPPRPALSPPGIRTPTTRSMRSRWRARESMLAARLRGSEALPQPHRCAGRSRRRRDRLEPGGQPRRQGLGEIRVARVRRRNVHADRTPRPPIHRRSRRCHQHRQRLEPGPPLQGRLQSLCRYPRMRDWTRHPCVGGLGVNALRRRSVHLDRRQAAFVSDCARYHTRQRDRVESQPHAVTYALAVSSSTIFAGTDNGVTAFSLRTGLPSPWSQTSKACTPSRFRTRERTQVDRFQQRPTIRPDLRSSGFPPNHRHHRQG